MQRKITLILGLLLVSLSINIIVQAQGAPEIVYFDSSTATIYRDNVPDSQFIVSWQAINRPDNSNLLFEQVLPDGTAQNAELPRDFVIVPSSGVGIIVPILTDDITDELVFRLRLVDLDNDNTLASVEIMIEISDSPTVVIDYFTSPILRINQDAVAGSRIDVSWSVSNRPYNTNLVFEQILPDGTARNAELPRDFVIVPSSGNGIVAPILTNGITDELVFRLSVVDLTNDNTLASAEISVDISNIGGVPVFEIIYFTSPSSSIERDNVTDSLIAVSWAVSNRPENTNLVFEQLMDDGTVRNAELPRDFVIVPSSGHGIVAPILPPQSSTQLIFRLRVVDLSNDSTLASTQINIDIINSGDDHIIVTGDACYQAPFAPAQGVSVGEEGRVQQRYNGTDAILYAARDQLGIATTLTAGDTFTIEDGPYCTYSPSFPSAASRMWFIKHNGQTGWIQEYSPNGVGIFAYYFIPADQDDLPQVQVDNFSLSQTSVTSAEFDNTDFVFSWETSNAIQVEIFPNQHLFPNLAVDDSVTLNGSDWDGALAGEIAFTLVAYDSQGNSENVTVTLTIESTSVSLIDFTVTPDTAAGNQQVTFSWEIEGDFESATIWYLIPYRFQDPVNIHIITSNTGTFVHTLPDDLPASDMEFSLTVIDNADFNLTERVTLYYDCAYDWGFDVSEASCPQSPLISQVGAYQAFDRGFMVWLPDESDTIIVFYNDNTVAKYSDSWEDSAYTIDGTAPEGFFEPERGFGYLWNTDASVRSGLGWAISSEESYTVNYQAALLLSGGTRDYIQLPNGQWVHLYLPDAATGLMWEYSS